MADIELIEPPNLAVSASTQIVAYFLDTLAVAFLGLGVAAVEGSQGVLPIIGNLGVGAVLGVMGIFWKRLSPSLPPAFVQSAVAVASDFRWWMAGLCLVAILVALPRLNTGQPATVAKTITKTVRVNVPVVDTKQASAIADLQAKLAAQAATIQALQQHPLPVTPAPRTPRTASAPTQGAESGASPLGGVPMGGFGMPLGVGIPYPGVGLNCAAGSGCSNNQSGGVTAGTVITTEPPDRVMTEAGEQKLLSLLPSVSHTGQINIQFMTGEHSDERESFATQIKTFLISKGYHVNDFIGSFMSFGPVPPGVTVNVDKSDPPTVQISVNENRP